MAGSFADAYEDAILNYIFGGDAIASLPASGGNFFVRLYTVAPAEDGTGGTEASFGGYAPKAVTRDHNASTGFSTSASGAGSITNNGDIDFGTATSTQSGNIVAAALWTASSGGTMVALDPSISIPKPITQGDPVKIPAGAATFTLT